MKTNIIKKIKMNIEDCKKCKIKLNNLLVLGEEGAGKFLVRKYIFDKLNLKKLPYIYITISEEIEDITKDIDNIENIPYKFVFNEIKALNDTNFYIDFNEISKKSFVNIINDTYKYLYKKDLSKNFQNFVLKTKVNNEDIIRYHHYYSNLSYEDNNRIEKVLEYIKNNVIFFEKKDNLKNLKKIMKKKKNIHFNLSIYNEELLKFYFDIISEIINNKKLKEYTIIMDSKNFEKINPSLSVIFTKITEKFTKKSIKFIHLFSKINEIKQLKKYKYITCFNLEDENTRNYINKYLGLNISFGDYGAGEGLYCKKKKCKNIKLIFES